MLHNCCVCMQAAMAAVGRMSSCALSRDVASLNAGFVIWTWTVKMALTRTTVVCLIYFYVSKNDTDVAYYNFQ